LLNVANLKGKTLATNLIFMSIMFNKIETYANQILKFSYIYFNFDVDGFLVVCYMLEVFSKSNRPSNFCQLSTNAPCFVTQHWYQVLV
jgi:hypothetical protein